MDELDFVRLRGPRAGWRLRGLRVALAAVAANAAPEVAQAHLLLLPTEVITAILEQLAAAGDYLAVCRAASSCVVLRAAASSAWKAAVEAALLPAAWRGAPPSSWQQCARDAFALDGAEWLEFAPRLREATFAHTAVEHGGAIYVFGGRDAANYSNRVHALHLRDGGMSGGTWDGGRGAVAATRSRRLGVARPDAFSAAAGRARREWRRLGRSRRAAASLSVKTCAGGRTPYGRELAALRSHRDARAGVADDTLPGLYRIVPADDDADSLRMDAMQLQDSPEAGTAATPPWRGAAVVVIGGAWRDGRLGRPSRLHRRLEVPARRDARMGPPRTERRDAGVAIPRRRVRRGASGGSCTAPATPCRRTAPS